jgi:propionyl-CoA synthetase
MSVIKLPLPPGCLPTLWNADERFREAISTSSRLLQDLRRRAMSTRTAISSSWRAPTTSSMSRATGCRPGGMEEVVAMHPDVAECAVIGIADAMKGQTPLGFVVLNAGVARDVATIEREVVALVRDKIGPVAAFKMVVTIKRLPKTRSGKILRRLAASPNISLAASKATF